MGNSQAPNNDARGLKGDVGKLPEAVKTWEMKEESSKVREKHNAP